MNTTTEAAPLHNGNGGARRRSSAKVLTCAACPTTWEYWKCGQLPKLCDPCRTTLRWCPKCPGVKPLDAFFNSQGSGHACRACCARPKIRSDCSGCGTSFARTSRGGNAHQPNRKHLCDECELALKWCSSCDGVRPHDDFSKALGKRVGRAAACHDCRRIKWAARTARDRLRRVVQKYGITVAEWDAMYAAQQGLCGSCGRPPAPDSYGLVIDHDHETGAVRSLLCPPCNMGLGHFGDNPDLLRRAAAYLEREREASR